MSLTPMFGMSQVFKYIDDFENKRIQELVLKLAYVGESFVNAARESGNYTDHTGNLRSSIGYVILLDGEIKKKEVKSAGVGTDGKTGTQAAEDFARWASDEFPTGFVLVGFAGMEYAAAVESRGYDVISGSIPLAQDLLKTLKIKPSDLRYMGNKI